MAICARNSPVTGEFPAQRPVTQSFDAFFDLHLNKRGWVNNRKAGDLRRQRPLWRHCNGSPTRLDIIPLPPGQS